MYKKKTVKLIPIFIIVILMMAACDNGVQLNGDNGETEINYNLTLSIEGEGQINSDDGSKLLDSNEGNKTIEYDEDATVKLVAEAATDYSFSH